VWRKASLEVTVTPITYVRGPWSSGPSGPCRLLMAGSAGPSWTHAMSSMSGPDTTEEVTTGA
jgi:hypothetical protein